MGHFPDQTQQQRASLTEEFYSAFAHLGETLAFMSPRDSAVRELAAAVRDLLLSFERQPKKLVVIGNRTAEWLDQPARPNQGVFLFGTVGQIQPQGSLFATELELASLKQRTVGIVSRIDPKGFYAPGDRILMLGALISDPAKKPPGIRGQRGGGRAGQFPNPPAVTERPTMNDEQTPPLSDTHASLPARRHRVWRWLVIGVLAILAGLAYREFWFVRPIGEGPAGPTVTRALFDKPWSDRKVLVFGAETASRPASALARPAHPTSTVW